MARSKREPRAPAPPMPTRRRLLLAVGSLCSWPSIPAAAQTRGATLRVVTAGVVNTLDPTMLGGTAEAGALSTCTYDRLLRFGHKPAPGATAVFDFDRIEGELAESFEVTPDGTTVTLTLRPGALWHDGSPVTAEDVKWSLDRAVTAPSLAKAQLATGSLVRAEQFAVLDERRVRIMLDRPDRLALPNLATTYAPMLNSRLARRHATEDDPWAGAWLKENVAGGGAYRLQSSVAGQQTVLVRNESWASGPRPGFDRLLIQTVPEAATRALLLARGDADLATGLQAQDLVALAQNGTVTVPTAAAPTGFAALIFNTRIPPFDQVAVRRALSWAIPYDAIASAAIQGRGTPLFGAGWGDEPPSAGFPQPLPLHTDLVRAKAMLAAAGHADGFDTTLTYGIGRAAFAEPAAALIQESFARIGVRVATEKLADAAMAAAVTAKRLPMLLERSVALFPSTEYFFSVFLNGDSRWNFASWADPDIAALLPQARFEPDAARHDAMARHLVGILADQVPMATLFQPGLDLALSSSLRGLSIGPAGYTDLRLLHRG